MLSPFPGMNPYLEQSVFWSSFHNRLIVAISDTVAPKILPKHYILEDSGCLLSLDESLNRD
jgi:hypothetical protein